MVAIGKVLVSAAPPIPAPSPRKIAGTNWVRYRAGMEFWGRERSLVPAGIQTLGRPAP